MEQYLTVNELWDIVTGAEIEPTTVTERAEFFRRQKSARAHIALHVTPSQLASVRLETDPKKIWDELQRLNRRGGFSTRIALRRELAKMKKDPEMPMSKWVISVRDLARQIKDLKGDISDEEIIVVLTDSLPDSYAPLVFQLDAMEEKDRPLSHVITRLIEEVRRQTEGRNREDPLALAAAAKNKRKDRSKITCFGCGEKGHYRSECQQEKEKLRGTLY